MVNYIDSIGLIISVLFPGIQKKRKEHYSMKVCFLFAQWVGMGVKVQSQVQHPPYLQMHPVRGKWQVS